MFTSISWHLYVVASFCFFVLYYGVIILMYYRKRIASGIARFRVPATSSFYANRYDDRSDMVPLEASATASLDESNEDQVGLFPLVHDLVDEIRALIVQSSIEQMVKEELTRSITILLQKYAMLRGTSFQEPITNAIIEELKENGLPALTTEELYLIWKW